MPSFGKGLGELGPHRAGKPLELVLPVVGPRLDAVLAEPFVAFGVPAAEHGRGKGIEGPPCDEAHRPRLHPVRQLPFDDGHFRRRIEHLQRPQLRRHPQSSVAPAILSRRGCELIAKVAVCSVENQGLMSIQR